MTALRRWGPAGVTAGLVFVLDQMTKGLVVHNLAPGETRAALPNLVVWTYVQNIHGAYGLFGDRPGLLIGLAVAVLILFGYAFADLMRRSSLARVAFGAIVAGALGNVVDRTRDGFVIDFISIKPLPFFEVFNVADAAICCGVALLVIASLSRGRPLTATDPSSPEISSSSGPAGPGGT